MFRPILFGSLLVILPVLSLSAQDLATGAADNSRIGSVSDREPICELSVTDATGTQEASISVLLTNEIGVIDGFTFDLCFNDSILDVDVDDVVPGAALDECVLSFFTVDVWTDGIAVEAVIDPLSLDFLEPGEALELCRIDADLDDTGTTDVEFCGDFLPATLFSESEEIEPDTDDGTVTNTPYLLSLDDPEEASGPVTVSVLAHSNVDLDGYDFSVCLSEHLRVDAVDDIAHGTATEGVFFEFEVVELTDDGWTVSALEWSPLGATMGPGDDIELYEVTYNVLTTGTASVDFCGDVEFTAGTYEYVPECVGAAFDVIADCNGNGIDDTEDLINGADDCNDNGVVDACDVDCDDNGVPDDCEEDDCDGDGVPDACEQDCDEDGVPDECQEDDCDGDGVPDGCEEDCDDNGVPDECQDSDCNDNGVIDGCETGDDVLIAHTSEATVDDLYGESISVHGSRIAVGAPDDEGVGAVYLYRRVGEIIEQVGRLEPEEGSDGDAFGRAIWQLDDQIIVGAPGDADNDSGAVYIFRWDPAEEAWTETSKLKADPPRAYSFFGTSLHSDGEKLIVGAPPVGSAGAHVFSWDPIDDQWTEEQRLTATATAGRLGISVAIDGNMALVGADFTNCGGVHVYDYDEEDEDWEHGQVFYPYDLPGVRFGRTMSLRGHELLVAAPLQGAGTVYYHTYDDNDGLWELQQVLYPGSGSSSDGTGAAVFMDENSFLIGLPAHGNSGVVYRYGHGEEDEWEEKAQLTDIDHTETGCAVASVDGRPLFTARSEESGSLGVYHDPDCNENGIPDTCEAEQDATTELDSGGFVLECATELLPLFLRGDASGDGTVSPVLDALFLFEYGFGDGTPPPCMDAADVDGNNTVSALLDAMALLGYGFLDAADPPYPGPELCGRDPDQDDEVTCDEPSEGCSP